MNVLIVDDDRFVVASLRNCLNWEELGFERVFTSYNISDAKSIIENHPIDLLLSDIDMPQGNGLELLSWIRGHHNDMPVIFLTNYADFRYAQRAVELQSFYYFLKPIKYDQLTAVIQNATRHLFKAQEQKKKNLVNFWNAFLRDRTSFTEELLTRYLSSYQIPYTRDSLFVPVLFDVWAYYLTPENRLENSFQSREAEASYIRTTFQAVFSGSFHPGDILFEYDLNKSRYLAILQLPSAELPPLLRMNLENFIELSYTQTHCTVNCFVGRVSAFQTLQNDFSSLCTMAENKLDCSRQTVFLKNWRPASGNAPGLNHELPELSLANGQYAEFLDYCGQYLDELSRGGCLNSLTITNFQIDVVQILYAFLKSRGILANKLFHGEDYHTLSENARRSVSSMKLYLEYIVKITQTYLQSKASGQSIAEAIKEYADRHYAEDISRSSLSDLFYLDSDYASRLFKEEFGISFKNYVINKRIEVAKDLLIHTNLPVNTVADNVGYGNYSYFTRIFKKITHITPVEFRDKMQR